MQQPVLTYGNTTVTLPYPALEGSNESAYDERAVRRRTLGGKLRTTILSYGFIYRLAFVREDPATYDAITSLWRGAQASNDYPTFLWSDGPWSSARTAISVGVEISPLTTPHPSIYEGDWTLTLTEVQPR